MGVSKNRGMFPPKWMVYNDEKPYEQMDDLEVFPYFWKHPYICIIFLHLLYKINNQQNEFDDHSQFSDFLVVFVTFRGEPWFMGPNFDHPLQGGHKNRL